MVTVLLSWLAIGTASLIFGKAIVDRIYRDDLDTMGKVDIYFMVGIIFLNIYAQIFSLFYKVGEAACIILFVAGVILTGKCIVRCIRERRSPVSFGFLKEHPYRLILIGGGGVRNPCMDVAGANASRYRIVSCTGYSMD